MYFHLVYSPERFAVASGRKSTCRLFRQETEPMVLIEHDFVGNCTSPSFAFLSCPFHMGISLLLRMRCIGTFFDTYGREKPMSKLSANANFVHL